VTDGNWAFPNYRTLATGVTLDMTGATLMFSQTPVTTTNGTPRPSKDLNILWGGGDNTIIGGTFDATPPPGWCGGGLRFSGKYRVSGTTIIGLKGSWETLVEVFAISSEGATDGSKVDTCVVRDVAPNAYVSGIYLGGTVQPEQGTDGSRVVACTVDLGAKNQHAYAATYKTTLVQCSGTGGRYGLYADTGDMTALAKNCDLSGTYAAVSSVGTARVTRRIMLEECALRGERGVEWFDKTVGGVMDGGVVVLRCKLDAHYTMAVAGKQGSIFMAQTTLAKPLNVVLSTGSFNPVVIL
jgi:hypothetical protein